MNERSHKTLSNSNFNKWFLMHL